MRCQVTVANPNIGLDFKREGQPPTFESYGSVQFGILKRGVQVYSEWIPVKVNEQLLVIPEEFADDEDAQIFLQAETGNTITFSTIRRLNRLDRPEESETVIG